MNIRLENENDYLEVEKLVRNSFWNVYRPGAYEHYIVHNLRKDRSFMAKFAYVIEKDEKIIGHINYSKGKISYENGELTDAVVLGPLSIDRNHQNKGYGTKLVNYTLNLIEKEDIPFVFVIGDENYYSRFGFESASKYNLFLKGCDINDECPFFMIRIFDPDKITYKRGIFSNPEVFDVNQEDVDEFDEQFEFKRKIVHENQL
ncbi:MAG: N-acetyltransferase [Methanobrevibacter sp.]|uniref:GNAT family N-acetyltransferase n=1 Tax=Methanobrevibacter sp. TaxID=66852 RepID=UPI0025F78EC2|nr:N-acetyltransferase [Methanobrevibacter sp.]MBR0271724.1 N-acetyltransferase [Methanobrevibacter sp.]